MNATTCSPQIINILRFNNMSCGDPDGLHELSMEYFGDVRARMARWPEMRKTGGSRWLREDLHRFKGGAAMFGFDRLCGLLDFWETDSAIDNWEVDLRRFESELEAVESSLAALRAERFNG